MGRTAYLSHGLANGLAVDDPDEHPPGRTRDAVGAPGVVTAKIR